jgi:hypothetical protein
VTSAWPMCGRACAEEGNTADVLADVLNAFCGSQGSEAARLGAPQMSTCATPQSMSLLEQGRRKGLGDNS